MILDTTFCSPGGKSEHLNAIISSYVPSIFAVVGYLKLEHRLLGFLRPDIVTKSVFHVNEAGVPATSNVLDCLKVLV